MAQEELLNDLRRRMDGALEVLRKEFGGLRTGRASASLLEPVMVQAYGGTVPLNQVASVNVPEPRMITVQVWDRSLVTPVEKAIREANLGVNPQSDGQLVRLPIPELSQERRQEFVKIVRKMAEDGRVAIRHVRRDAMEQLKKHGHDSGTTVSDFGTQNVSDGGVASGETLSGAFAQQFFQHLSAGVQKVEAMPDTTFEERIARAVTMMRHNRDFKRQAGSIS